MTPDNSEIIIYQTEDGLAKISVRLEGETVWLTQADMVELFLSSKPNISEHIRHIFDEGGNSSRRQLFGISEYLPLTVKTTPRSTNTISDSTAR